ncbi:MAG TPA: S49 family peptidase [Tepidisphaeraceae bacterium]|jgi:signal peptide peptidase SppA|nr:S49 family peptidase [Tepidisphaeraceae bacterium]
MSRNIANTPAAKAALIQSISGQWVMSEPRVRELARRIAKDVAGDGMQTPAPGPAGYTVADGVARIDVIGVLTKYETWWDDYYGLCAADRIQGLVDAAFNDPAVRTVAFVIDSPGGMAAGTVQLGDFIRRRADATGKATMAVVSDQAASGGYWLAAACDTIVANSIAEVGSIGAFELWTDDTKFWADLGITFTVVSSGGVKGAGADGSVPPELVAESQRGVDALYEQFVAWVATRRQMSDAEARALADGRVWIAAEAVTKRLIDRVQPLDAAMSAEKERIANMDREQFIAYVAAHPDHLQEVAQPLVDKAIAATKPNNATASELKAAFPEDKDFVMDRLDIEAPIAEHKVAYADHVKAKLTAAGQKNDELQKKIGEIDPSHAGHGSAINTPTGDQPAVSSLARMNELRKQQGLPAKTA